MPATTENYPKQESEWFDWIRHHGFDLSAIVDWMRSRPVAPDDNAMHRLARWTYCVTDHGVIARLVVRDNLDGTEFAVPVNIEDI